MTNDSLAIGRLRARQGQLTPGKPLEQTYDLFISAVSWESRNATALDAIGGCSAPALLLRFESSKPATDLLKDANQLKLTMLCPNNQILSLQKSTAFDANSEAIETALRDRFQVRKAPLSVLLDISCIPKAYISFLCGLGFTNDYVCRLDCLYSEGTYDLAGASTPGGPLSIISEGEWTSQQIPYLEASDMFSSKRDLIVILGGEIGYSLPFIERYEPERLGVVFIRNGLDVEALVGSEKAAYAELISEPKLLRADYDIDDVLGVLAHVHAFCSAGEGRPVVGLAIGSKAQSLALALAALDLDNLEIVCRIPTSYSNADVLPTGRVFLYAIEDRFEPTSYF
jgi:hypothetical protein